MRLLRRTDRSDTDVASFLANLDRLDAVTGSGLMGAPPSPRLDDITRRASEQLRAPIALMSILDDERAFYLAQSGLTGAVADAREEPAEGTYCRYVVGLDEVVAIEDALTDDLVKHHPATTSGRVRSYLGVPIRGNGQTLGSFCVADTEPREWTDEDLAVLRELAREAFAT